MRQRLLLSLIFGSSLLSTVLSLSLASVALAAQPQSVEVKHLRMWSSPDSTRLVFDINAPVEHSVLVLRDPDRVVIDLKNTRAASLQDNLDFSQSHIQRIRSAARNDTDLRVVLDMKVAVNPKSFVLNPTQGYGHRLVLDLDQVQTAVQASAPVVKTVRQAVGAEARPVVIAIDAGHGGEDPGAIGPRGTREKQVVLEIAHKLQHLIEQEPGMSAVMIRDGDYYVSLRGRMQRARAHKADLFVSIHADAVRNGHARGASVYVLSEKGASSEAARWLAASQNDSDLIGGVSLDDKDDLLASVLLDLSQNATIAASTDVADKILSEIRHVGKLHKMDVERAAFMVLKSPDIPSILVETGFISNRKEEGFLRDGNFQTRIARALLKGIHKYFKDYPPPGTLLAQRSAPRQVEYEIKRGDTLASIAREYSVSLPHLRSLNSLSSDVLRVGQTLRIPDLH